MKLQEILKESILDLWEFNNTPVRVYVHNPFCFTNCLYCPFHGSIISQNYEESTKYQDYITYLISQIDFYSNIIANSEIETYCFGGGTANIMSIDDMRMVFEKIPNFKQIESKLMEIHPSAYIEEQSLLLGEYNFNSIILCIQTFDKEYLKKQNRIYKNYENIPKIISDFKKQNIYVLTDFIIFWKEKDHVEKMIYDMFNVASMGVDEINLAIDYSFSDKNNKELYPSEDLYKTYCIFILEFCKKFGYYPSGLFKFKDETLSYEKIFNILREFNKVNLIKNTIPLNLFINKIYPQYKSQDDILKSEPTFSILGIGSKIENKIKPGRMKNIVDIYSKIGQDFQYIEVYKNKEPVYFKQFDINDYKSDSEIITEFFKYISNIPNISGLYLYIFESFLYLKEYEGTFEYKKNLNINIQSKGEYFNTQLLDKTNEFLNIINSK